MLQSIASIPLPRSKVKPLAASISMLGLVLSLLSSWAQPAYAAGLPDKLLLSMEFKVGGRMKEDVQFYGTDIDPNSRSIDDRYQLVINGKERKVSTSLLAQLDVARRNYSYDSFTGGIKRKRLKALCMMAGQPSGLVLNARYLTYKDSRIVSSQMRPVYSEQGNCLFDELYAPAKSRAKLEAAKALAILKTLLQVYTQR